MTSIRFSGHLVKGRLGLLVSGVCFGTVPTWAVALKHEDVGVAIQITSRLATSFVLLAVLPLGVWKVAIQSQPLLVLNGLCMAGSFATYLTALQIGAPPARAVALVYLYPIWLLVAGWGFLGERLSKVGVGTLAAAIMGAVITTRFWSSTTGLGLGDALAIANGMLLAAMILISKVLGRRRVPPLTVARWTFGYALALVLGWVLVSSTSWGFGGESGYSSLSSTSYALVACLGLIGTALAYIFMYRSAPLVPASESGLWLAAEAVTVVLLAALTGLSSVHLTEVLGLMFIVGAGACAAIFNVNRTEAKGELPEN